jgi:hypothetical protein
VGFYLRKSVKAGPFRFNMSKSGLGVSAGVPGFRVGTGPRGNYVNIGGRGVYYRSTSRASSSPSVYGQSSRARTPVPQPSPVSDVLLEDVTGATAMSLAPTGGGDLVEQLNASAAKFGWGWPVTIGVVVLGGQVGPYAVLVWALFAPLCWWLFMRDKGRRTAVVFYDVNDAPALWFDSVVASWAWLTG